LLEKLSDAWRRETNAEDAERKRSENYENFQRINRM
jgi:hypothetical protein